MDSSKLMLVFASFNDFIRNSEEVFQIEISKFTKRESFKCAGVNLDELKCLGIKVLEGY